MLIGIVLYGTSPVVILMSFINSRFSLTDHCSKTEKELISECPDLQEALVECEEVTFGKRFASLVPFIAHRSDRSDRSDRSERYYEKSKV